MQESYFAWSIHALSNPFQDTLSTKRVIFVMRDTAEFLVGSPILGTFSRPLMIVNGVISNSICQLQ